MRQVEYWRWVVLNETTGKRQATRYRMKEADALAMDPQAERVPGSMELRQVPDVDEHPPAPTFPLRGPGG